MVFQLERCSRIQIIRYFKEDAYEKKKYEKPFDVLMKGERNKKYVDVIIVTPIHVKHGIINFLRQYYKGDIITLENILDKNKLNGLCKLSIYCLETTRRSIYDKFRKVH